MASSLPTKEEMLGALGSSATKEVVARFNKLGSVPNAILESLARDSLHEEWGDGYFALRKYLSVQIPWAIEQGRYVESDGTIYFAAGHLHTRYGTPLFLGFRRTTGTGRTDLLQCNYCGTNPSCPILPESPKIPEGEKVAKASEIVMLHDHMLEDNGDRVPYLSKTPRVAQICAIAGAIQWSLNRGLELPYFYFGKVSYLVPLYLQSRENITEAPDLVAPVQLSAKNLVVRTILLPYMTYANARVAVERHDRLPPWMLAAWNEHARSLSEQQLD